MLARLLRDDQLDLTDRVAGAVLLLCGQQLSRITAITVELVICDGHDVRLRLGPDPIELPSPSPP